MSQQGRLVDASSDLESLTGNVGGPVMPTVGGTINIVGSGGVLVTGNPGTNTLTITDSGSSTIYNADAGTASPIAGEIDIIGGVVVAGTSPIATSGATNVITINAQISQAIAAADATKIGLCNFDSSVFSVDADGFVTLASGGMGIDSISPNSGTDPVVPDGTGLVNMIGAGSITTVGSLNTLTTQLTGLTNHAVQIGAGTTTLTQSNIGTDGQVFLGATGADPAFATLTSTGGTITFTPGANTLNLEADASIATSYLCDNAASAVPAAGVLTVTGGTTTAGTSPLVTSGAGSTVTINAQRSQALAAADSTKVGLSNFDSTYFTVDSDGFVSTAGTGIGETITGDSGGALSPTAGNWNIIGSEDISTSGSVSTLTINQAVNYKLSFMFGGM